MRHFLRAAIGIGAMLIAVPTVARAPAAPDAYFGDLHVHSRYSFDAFLFGIHTSPDDAYRYARGEPLPHPTTGQIQLAGPPLDFLAVTDHAEYLGVVPRLADPDLAPALQQLAELVNAPRLADVMRGHSQIARAIVTGEADPNLDDRAVVRSTWQAVIDAAERHYQPGNFTTFIGFEFTPHPGANMHRNVIFRGSRVADTPFSAFESLEPEALWSWLDRLRDHGIEAMAIPHNANWSNGAMFAAVGSAGAPLSADYAEQRSRNEPLIELIQSKGTSETHPGLSPNDEWAGFELFGDRPGHVGGVTAEQVRLAGSYARDALKTGLAMADAHGFNPFRFGFIGSSDTHNTGASYDETDYVGKLGTRDGTAALRGSLVPDAPLDPGSQAVAAQQVFWGSAGLAGVWATANTREALYDAMRRGDTFATSGPRIRLRLLAGSELPADVLDHPQGADAVVMGGTLPTGPDAPEVAVWAMQDPAAGRLQRLQIVKLWVRDGVTGERVYDVACADGREVDATTHRCGDFAPAVDVGSCKVDPALGAAELSTVWRDPDHRGGERALYYARALEHPTCRWSTWDAVRAGVEPNPAVPATIQERAWTSPLWLVPAPHLNR